MNFTEFPPQERMMFIAKIYHNIWYDNERFEVINKLLKQWDENPIREAKFLHEIQNDSNNDIV